MDQLDQELVKALQGNIPLVENPYEEIGINLGISEDEVIERIRNLKDSNRLKRIGAALRHKESGYTFNAMVVFKTDSTMTDKIGMELSLSPLVSHCYERMSYESWPYNLYAMLHSRKENEIEAFVESVIYNYGIDCYDILFSVKELKKTSMVYFA